MKNITLFFTCIAIFAIAEAYNENSTDATSHSRQKRFIYYTADRRLTFPRGSAIVFAVTLKLPVFRNMPDGYSSKMTISVPLAFNLDALYWTADENPYGLYPDLSKDNDEVKKRSIEEFGSMSYLYRLTEGVFDYLGHPGKECFKRAICELRQGPMKKSYGWVKYGLEWLLTPSKMDEKNNDVFSEYHEAEYHGKNFDCSMYHTQCPVSIFTSRVEPNKTESHHSRQKRLIFMTTQGFALPPSTSVALSFVYKCPLLQFPPIGIGPDFQFSTALGINPSDYGWTSEENPYGTWPDLSNLGVNLITRKKRSLAMASRFGSLSHLYATISSLAEKMGYPGKTCLKRAICEMQEGELAHSYGWFKKILHWVLTPSSSADRWENLREYTDAEYAGRYHLCYKYHKCKISIFGSHHEEFKSAPHRRKYDKDDNHYAEANNLIDASDSYAHLQYSNSDRIPEDDKYVSFHETVRIHNMVDIALRSARLGARMYSNIM